MVKSGLVLACVALAQWVSAQQAPQMEALPIDPNVRYGVLDNGLTYYVRHNETPKNRAEFHIAQKVGSILENEVQCPHSKSKFGRLLSTRSVRLGLCHLSE